jgi:hypothetical protein
MRVGRGLGELRLQPGQLCLQSCDLLTQGSSKYGLNSAARTLADSLTCAHILSQLPILHLSGGKGQQQAPRQFDNRVPFSG